MVTQTVYTISEEEIFHFRSCNKLLSSSPNILSDDTLLDCLLCSNTPKLFPLEQNFYTEISVSLCSLAKINFVLFLFSVHYLSCEKKNFVMKNFYVIQYNIIAFIYVQTIGIEELLAVVIQTI